jgi:DNA-binding NarL/FixJ family response regulator
MKLKILVADDHAIVRAGYISILKSQFSALEFHEAANGAEAIAVARKVLPDIILMDYIMPKMDGIRAASIIREHHPDIKIIIISMEMNEDVIMRARAGGVKGYLAKHCTTIELTECIQDVMKGKYYFSACLGQLPEKLISIVKGEKGKNHSLFTPREMDIIVLVAYGYTSERIAKHLNISRRTVENHRLSMHEKTGTKTTGALVRFAISNGLIAA